MLLPCFLLLFRRAALAGRGGGEAGWADVELVFQVGSMALMEELRTETIYEPAVVPEAVQTHISSFGDLA